MSTYLKHMGGYTYKQLKGKSFDEIQKLSDKWKEQQQEFNRNKDLVEDKGYMKIVEEDDEAELIEGIDKEDLLTLWKLVKTKHGDIRPEDDHYRVFVGRFESMFEPDISAKAYDKAAKKLMKTFKEELEDSEDKHQVIMENYANENSEAKASKAKPKAIRKNNSAPIIKDWVSNNEEDDVPQDKIEKKTFKPSFAKIEFVKPKQQEKTARKTVNHVDYKKNIVPRAVLMKSGLVSVNTVRQVNVAHTKTTVNAARPMPYLFKIAHLTVKWPIHKNTSFKNSNFNQRFDTVKDKNSNTVRPKEVVNVARPKAIVNAVKGNPQIDLQDQGVIDSGCSRHMTGNMFYLINYEEIDGGYVAFGGNPKRGRITSIGTIKTGNLDFENVYFDTECIVLSPNFKLPDESQVLLKVPRKNNTYSVALKNIVPKGGLTCLFAKATSDESKLWHRRLRHINFKTMNKLVKGNLVRGLPSKLFENNQTCIACQKRKQHRASYDYRRFSWVFFLATKDETSGILKSFITEVENLID
ncbi:ribonuclease H-like domain-containing protein [Tanacetum coccineum]